MQRKRRKNSRLSIGIIIITRRKLCVIISGPIDVVVNNLMWARWLKPQGAWLRAGQLGFDSGRRRFFFSCSSPDWSGSPLSLLYNKYRDFPGVKTAQGRVSHLTFSQCRGFVLVVDLSFTTLLTSQVISIAFYSEREKDPQILLRGSNFGLRFFYGL